MEEKLRLGFIELLRAIEVTASDLRQTSVDAQRDLQCSVNQYDAVAFELKGKIKELRNLNRGLLAMAIVFQADPRRFQ